MRAARRPKHDPIAVRIPDAVAMIGISRSSLYEFIARGEIEAIKAGRATLILVSSLHEFIARRRSDASQAVDS